MFPHLFLGIIFTACSPWATYGPREVSCWISTVFKNAWNLLAAFTNQEIFT